MKKNLDLVAAYVAALGGLALLRYVSVSCTGAGCVFGLVQVVGLLLIALVAALVALKRRVRSENLAVKLSPLPALGVIGICMVVIGSSVGPV